MFVMIRAAILRHRRLFLCVLIWYSAALLLTAGNKTLLDVLEFPYPIFATFVHFAGVGILMAMINRSGVIQPSKDRPANVAAPDFIRDFLPISLFTALEVALTNQAYSMVSLSVLTALKSTVVATTYVVSMLFNLDRFSWKLSLSLLWIIASVAISLPGMGTSSTLGICLLIAAVCCAALRWVLIQREIQKRCFPVTDLISLTQPLAALCLVPLAMIFDGTRLLFNLQNKRNALPNAGSALTLLATGVEWLAITSVLLLVSTLLVTILLYLEFKVVEDSSSLTLVVIGTGRECLTVIMSMIIFKESLQIRAWLGLLSSIAGIIYYAYLRGMAEQQKGLFEVELEKITLSSRNTTANTANEV